MKLSVIIPTHNRADTLKIALEKLMAQQGVDFEVIVVDDGSTDNTKQAVESLEVPAGSGMTSLRYIHQPASHQGTARNRGAEVATGDIIVFGQDDIFPEPGFLMRHHDRHTEYPDENVVVLGYTTWDPDIEITPYMRFLESSGWQFGYKFLHPKWIGRMDPWKFFYTSNISLKKSFFDKEKFNEQFQVYGWEDIELGYRLYKNHGMKIYYEPQAIAFHHHHIVASGLAAKMRNVGSSAIVFQKLHPDAAILPRGLKAILIRLAANPVTLPLFRLLGRNAYYKAKSWSEFLRGMEGS